jgi:hypothetical protein
MRRWGRGHEHGRHIARRQHVHAVEPQRVQMGRERKRPREPLHVRHRRGAALALEIRLYPREVVARDLVVHRAHEVREHLGVLGEQEAEFPGRGHHPLAHGHVRGEQPVHALCGQVHHSPLHARWAEAAVLAAQSDDELVPARRALHAREPSVQATTAQVPFERLQHVQGKLVSVALAGEGAERGQMGLHRAVQKCVFGFASCVNPPGRRRRGRYRRERHGAVRGERRAARGAVDSCVVATGAGRGGGGPPWRRGWRRRRARGSPPGRHPGKSQGGAREQPGLSGGRGSIASARTRAREGRRSEHGPCVIRSVATSTMGGGASCGRPSPRAPVSSSRRLGEFSAERQLGRGEQRDTLGGRLRGRREGLLSGIPLRRADDSHLDVSPPPACRVLLSPSSGRGDPTHGSARSITAASCSPPQARESSSAIRRS